MRPPVEPIAAAQKALGYACFGASKLEDTGRYLVDSALKIIQKEDPEWASDWVAEGVAAGHLLRDDWLEYVRHIPEGIKRALLETLENEEVQHARLSRSVALLAACSDVALARRVFEKLCAIRKRISEAPDKRHELEWAVQRQLGDLFRAIPVNVAVEGLADHLAGEVDTIGLRVVTELFGRLSPDDSSLRTDLNEDLRQSLRAYLKNGVAVALREDDFSGNLKAELATALSLAGDPHDMDDLRQLIRADIDRVRSGRAAQQRGEGGGLASGAHMSYSSWHVRAVVRLDPLSADEVLLEVLREAEYEREAAGALAGLAHTIVIETAFGVKKDFDSIWDARAGRSESKFDEARRERLAVVIKEQINDILGGGTRDAQRSHSEQRAKALAVILARIDARQSADFVLEIASLPGDWDAWTKVDALENLLFGGAPLPATSTLDVVDPILAQIRSHHQDNQKRYLLQRILCILPFLDVPARGFDVMRQLIAEFRIRGYELCETVTAVGCSRCDEAVDFLRELLESGQRTEQGWEACINALAAIDDDESRELLLSFADPDDPKLSAWEGDVLAHTIAELVKRDIPTQRRILDDCSQHPSSARRDLLARIVSRIDCEEAALAGLNLIDDKATPAVPRETWQQLENIFVERQPYRGSHNTFTLVPRSSNAIRTGLFEMAMSDDRRKKAAFDLLGQIELWRLEYGRPAIEPRHPALASGVAWPIMDTRL